MLSVFTLICMFDFRNTLSIHRGWGVRLGWAIVYYFFLSIS